MTATPTIRWAQRSNAEDAAKNVIFLTVEITDPKDVKVNLTSTKLDFSASSNNQQDYEFSLEFFDEIDTENSKTNLESGSHVSFLLRKKNKQEEYWPRLTKEKAKYRYIKTDFDKWVEEDEQDEQNEEEDFGMGGMPGMGAGMEGMGGMPGMPGMGGMPGMEGLGGAGGAGGMPDLASLMQQMGGAGGMGGDFDISKLASQLGGAGGLPDLGEEGAEAQEGEEAEAEEAEAKK